MAKASYTKMFADPYPNGWKAKPDLSTPYLTTIRDNHDATLRAIENHLYNNPLVSNLQDDDDVAISDLADGQVLAYNASTHKFQNIDPPSGGGGENYSFNEVEIGTDEQGLTVYSKTWIQTPLEGEDYLFQANGSGGSSPIDYYTTSPRREHRIYPKRFFGTFYFDDGSELPLNYIDPTNFANSTPYTWTKAIPESKTYSNYSSTYMNYSACFRYYDQETSSFKYRYVTKIRYTVIYTKVSL